MEDRSMKQGDSAFTFFNTTAAGTQEEILRINNDYTITLNDKWNVNDAAMTFWKCVENMRPQRSEEK